MLPGMMTQRLGQNCKGCSERVKSDFNRIKTNHGLLTVKPVHTESYRRLNLPGSLKEHV